MAERYVQLPSQLDLVYVPGDDLTVTVEISDENGLVVDMSAATTTVTARIHPLGDETVSIATFLVAGDAAGLLTLTLPAAVTTTLGFQAMSWTCKRTDIRRTWFAGSVEPRAAAENLIY